MCVSDLLFSVLILASCLFDVLIMFFCCYCLIVVLWWWLLVIYCGFVVLLVRFAYGVGCYYKLLIALGWLFICFGGACCW